MVVGHSVTLKGLADTGSDVNVIHRSDLDWLVESGLSSSVSYDSGPVKLQFLNGEHSECSHRTILSFNIRFAAFQRRVDQAEFVVFDGSTPFPIIIGNSTLKTAGVELAIIQDASSTPTRSGHEARINFTVQMSANKVLEETFRQRRLPDDKELGMIAAEYHKQRSLCSEAAFEDMINILKSFRYHEDPCENDIQVDRFVELYSSYRDIFSPGIRPIDIGPIKVVALQESIRIDYVPNVIPNYPASALKERKTWDAIMVLMALGVVQFHSNGVHPSACPTLFTGSGAKDRLVVNTAHQGKMLVPIPHTGDTAEHLIKRIAGNDSRNRPRLFFFATDIPGAFHQIRHHADTPKETRLMTALGRTFCFDRLIMGGFNSMAQLGVVLDSIFNDLDGHAHSADDLRNSASSIDDFFTLTEIFFQRCRHYNIPLNPEKTVPISQSTYWCGYQIDKDGYIPDPRSAELIRSIPCPTNGAELVQGIGLLRWMSSALVDFPRRVLPLQEVINTIYERAGSRKSSKARRIPIDSSVGWTEAHKTLWRSLLDESATKLSHRKSDKHLVLVTDASATGWCGILLQVDDLKKPLDIPDVLGCMGGNFDSTMKNWPTIEQEGYAVKRSIERMWHIINDGTPLLVLSDNMSLTSIFDASSDYLTRRDGPGRGRLLRWCEFISHIPHEIRHLPGEENDVADFISRLRDIPPDPIRDDENDFEPIPSLSARIFAIDAEHATRTSSDPDWVQPSIIEIRNLAGDSGEDDEATFELARSCDCSFDMNERVWKDNRGRVLLPNKDIRLRTIIMAHCQGAGHRGVTATLAHLEAVVFWPEMKNDVSDFCKGCIHCIAEGPRLMLRPYGQPLTPSDRNQVLSADFLHLGDSAAGYSKLLILTDKFSGFSMMFPAESENSMVVAEAMNDWIAMFGVPAMFMTDMGPGFANETIAEITKCFGIDQHIISAEAHWSNGKQERLNKIVGSLFRKLVSENRLTPDRWHELIPVVQMAYNHTPTESLAGYAPVTVFTGLDHARPLESFLSPRAERIKINNADLTSSVSALLSTLRERTTTVHAVQEQHFYKRQAAQARRRNVRPLILQVGDFVMVRNPAEHKLAQRWVGPARIVRVIQDQMTYEIEPLTKIKGLHRDRIYHARLLQFFDYKTMVVSPEIERQALFYAQRSAVPEKFLSVRFARGNIPEIQVKWLNDDDPTWEPLSVIHEYVPEHVESFVIDDLPKLSVPASLRKRISTFLGFSA